MENTKLSKIPSQYKIAVILSVKTLIQENREKYGPSEGLDALDETLDARISELIATL